MRVVLSFSYALTDIVDILTFLFASTGERFGIIYTFSSFKNRDLERRRTLAFKQLRVTLSVWLYLLTWCSQSVCGIVKHVNEHRNYESPLIMLSDTGNIVVQVQRVDGEEQAFTAHTALSLHTCISLDIFFQVSEVKLTITKILTGEKTLETIHFFDFRQPVQFNDIRIFCDWWMQLHARVSWLYWTNQILSFRLRKRR